MSGSGRKEKAEDNKRAMTDSEEEILPPVSPPRRASFSGVISTQEIDAAHRLPSDDDMPLRMTQSMPVPRPPTAPNEKKSKKSAKEFASTLHDKFSDFVHSYAEGAEQDLEELRGEMQKCLEMVKDLLHQESDARGAMEKKVEKRCATLEAAILALTRDHKANSGDHKDLQNDHDSVKQRLDYLENMFGAWADKHTKEVTTIQGSHDKLKMSHDKLATDFNSLRDAHEQHLEVEESLDTAVKGLTSAAEQTAKALAAAKAKLDQMHEGVLNCEEHCAATETKNASLADRLREMERRVDTALSSITKEQEYLSGVVKQNHNEIVRMQNDNSSNLDDHKVTVKANLDNFDKRYGDLSDKHNAQAKALKSFKDEHSRDQRDMKDRLESCERWHSHVTEKQEAQAKEIKVSREEHAKRIQEVSAFRSDMENGLGELAHNTALELKGTRDELDQLLALLAGVQRAWRPCVRSKSERRRNRVSDEAASPKTPIDLSKSDKYEAQLEAQKRAPDGPEGKGAHL